MSAIYLPPFCWRLLSAAYVPTRRPELTFGAVYAPGLTSSFAGELPRRPIPRTSVNKGKDSSFGRYFAFPEKCRLLTAPSNKGPRNERKEGAPMSARPAADRDAQATTRPAYGRGGVLALREHRRLGARTDPLGVRVTGATEGREGVRRLLGRIVLWRVGFRWYLFVLVGTPTIVVLSTLAMPGALASFQAEAVPRVLFLYVVAGLFFLFAGGPFFEEIGWRGFALPRLQALYGPLVGSLVLGVLWGLWHLPLFLIPSWDTPHGSVLDVALFVVLALALTVVLTWVFNNTKGSVLVVILAHGSLNISAVAMYDLFPAPSVTEGITNVVVGFGAAAALVVILTRGHLGYRNYLQQEDRGSA